MQNFLLIICNFIPSYVNTTHTVHFVGKVLLLIWFLLPLIQLFMSVSSYIFSVNIAVTDVMKDLRG